MTLRPRSASSVTIPDSRALQKALRKTTESLARELLQPRPSPPDWSECEWVVARAVAAIHGVAPLLSRVLRWSGPEDWLQHLREQAVHAATRHERIQELLRQIHTRARIDGIPLVALKGAALYALDVYAPGERPMADVDLLVNESREAAAVRALQRLGFHETYRTWKHRVFDPLVSHPNARFGEHAANPLRIELHTRLMEPLPRRRVDIASRVFSPIAQPGLNGYASKAVLMMHLLHHAAGAMVVRVLRLVQLCDISRLAAHMCETDWSQLAEAARGESAWWAFPPLAMTAHYFPSGSVPEPILAHFAAQCTWLLRRKSSRQALSDVSLSQPLVSALPGLEWAQSPGELLSYAARRVIPDPEVMAERRIASTLPAHAGDSWTHLSQTQRVLAWLTTRPMRAGSIHPVREAFAQFAQHRQ